VDARLSSSNPNIVVLREISSVFNVLEANKSVQFTPVLDVSRSTAFGGYSLTLTLTYADPEGVSHSDSFIFGILVDAIKPREQTEIVLQTFQIDPFEIHPGDEFVVNLELSNSGNPAYNVQTQLLVDSQVPVYPQSPSIILVGNLDSNQTAIVKYTLRVSGDASEEAYILQILISYLNEYGEIASITEKISIEVHSIIDFQLLDVQPSSLTVSQGETGTLEADLLLIGTESIDFVQLSINTDSDSPFTSIPETEEYIGRVDPDSPIPFELPFTVDSNATSGDYPLQCKVNYWDEYNQEQTKILHLSVTITEQVQNGTTANTVSFWDQIWNIFRNLFGIKP
jgi:hypothetical protein